MWTPFAPEVAGIVVVVLVLAGTVNGVAGFGFALLGTMALASIVDPATAVVFLILPVIAVNLSLASELSGRALRQCGRRFWPLVASALVGTIVGMAVLGRLPSGPLRLGLGVLTLGFVATAQRRIPVPGRRWVEDRCFVGGPVAMVGIGAVSGLVFGGTNVGVQLVAYLRSFELSHGVFVGVVAMVFLGLNTVRVGAAGLLGLYPAPTWVIASALGAIPAVLGVALGRRVRSAVPDRIRRRLVLGLLAVVGLRLIVAGLGLG